MSSSESCSPSRSDDAAKMTYSAKPMPLLSISSEETIQKCAALKLRPTDCFICSYPKSGTTWLQHIVLSLLHCHLSNTSPGHNVPMYKHVSEYAPFFEIDAHWQGNELAPKIQAAHDLVGRRIFNTHLRCDMLPAANGGKFIYIMRSPLDTCLSFYHHLSNQVEGGCDGSFEAFFDEWLEGEVPYGSWFDHVLSYSKVFQTLKGLISKLPDGREFLLVTYEDLSKDLSTVVGQLVDFLELNVSSSQQQELLPTFSFSHMKSNLDRFQPQSVSWKNNFSFLRKGVSGDWASVVTKDQEKRYRERIKNSGFDRQLEICLKEANPDVYSKIRSLLESHQS